MTKIIKRLSVLAASILIGLSLASCDMLGKATLAISGDTEVSVGYTISLSVARDPADSTVTYKWSSGDEAKATVNGTGATAIVKGVTEGEVVISVTDSTDASTEYTITVVSKDKKKGTPDKTVADVDYESYASDFALIVKNSSTKNMVLFYGEPKNGNVLGGVKGGQTNYLKNNKEIFTATTDYIVYVVTEEDYNEYYATKPETLGSSPYVTFYAVYNKTTTNENVYEISKNLGGEYKLVINNGTSYNVELRNMGPTGETLAFVMNNTYEKSYRMEEGEYMIFPVFRKYDKNTSEIISTFPTYKTGQLAGEAKSYEFSLDAETTSRQFNVKDWSEGINFTPSATYIKIINNADQGLQFFTGADTLPEVTSAGGKRINTSKSLVYAITMDKLTSNKYEEARIVAGYRVGTNRISNIYLNGDASKEETYKAGYMYTYTITGNAEEGYESKPLTEKITVKETVLDDEGNEVEKDVEKEVLKAQQVDWSDF